MEISELKPGDGLLLHGTRLPDQIIGFFESQFYKGDGIYFSHVALYIGDGKLIEAQALRKHGIEIHDISEYEQATVVRYPGLSPLEADNIVQYAKDQQSNWYDYIMDLVLGVKYLFNIDVKWHDPHAFECAELFSRSFDSVGINLFDDAFEVSPQSLYDCKKLDRLGIVNLRA